MHRGGLNKIKLFLAYCRGYVSSFIHVFVTQCKLRSVSVFTFFQQMEILTSYWLNKKCTKGDTPKKKHHKE